MEFRLQTIIALSIALLMLGCSTQTTTSAVPANLGDTSVQETIVLEDDDREIPTEPEELVVEKKDEIVVNPKSTKTFVFTGRNFMFEMAGGVNPTIRVKKGDTVKIEFTSTDGFHDWTIDKETGKA